MTRSTTFARLLPCVWTFVAVHSHLEAVVTTSRRVSRLTLNNLGMLCTFAVMARITQFTTCKIPHKPRPCA